MKIILFIYFLIQIYYSIFKLKKEKTTFEINQVINVHIVPHSHDDAGWIYSFENYYTGNNNSGTCVKCILDNMVKSLKNKSERKFTIIEISYFHKWYIEQSPETKETIKQFIQNKRIEFANCGWVANDEATTNYQDIINQVNLGLDFLKKEFNYNCRTAWLVD